MAFGKVVLTDDGQGPNEHITVAIKGQPAGTPTPTPTPTSNPDGKSESDCESKSNCESDPDTNSGPTLSIDDVSIAEGTLRHDRCRLYCHALPNWRPQRRHGPVTVDFATEDDTATAPRTTPRPAERLPSRPGETSKTISVPVIGDHDFEPDETFYRQSVGSNQARHRRDGQGIGTIVNDDAPPTQALNLSTRMRVSTGDRVGIGGFIVTGPVPKQSRHPCYRTDAWLASNIPDLLADPVLELHGPSGLRDRHEQ